MIANHRDILSDFDLYRYLQSIRPRLEFRVLPDRINGGRVEGRYLKQEQGILSGWFFVGYRDDLEREAAREGGLRL